MYSDVESACFNHVVTGTSTVGCEMDSDCRVTQISSSLKGATNTLRLGWTGMAYHLEAWHFLTMLNR